MVAFVPMVDANCGCIVLIVDANFSVVFVLIVDME